MTADYEVIEQNDRYRVRIVRDEYPENPREMGDSFASVLTQLSNDYVQPDKDDYDQRIIEAWDSGNGGCDTEFVERYARAFLDAVAVDWLDDPTSSSRIFGYVTRERAEELGVTDPAAALKGELAEYAAYTEGDVYGVIVEEKLAQHTTLRRGDEVVAEADDEVWQEVEYPTWGYYGYEYAEQEARYMFQAATSAKE